MTSHPGRTTRELLKEALVHLDLAQRHAATGQDDQLTVDAICLRLSAGIETLSRLEPPVRESLFGSTWRAMWGMRNRIAHGYLLVDSAIVERTLAHATTGNWGRSASTFGDADPV